MQLTSTILALVVANGLVAAAVGPSGYGGSSSTASTCSWHTASTCSPVLTSSVETLSKPVTVTKTVTSWKAVTSTTEIESVYYPMEIVTVTRTSYETSLVRCQN